MELASGGELFDRLIDAGKLAEATLEPYLFAMADALAYLHGRGIVHRDIKLENALLDAEDPRALKLIDFGLSVRVELDVNGRFVPKRYFDSAGSKSYRAPEMLARGGGYQLPPTDVWALGIV